MWLASSEKISTNVAPGSRTTLKSKLGTRLAIGAVRMRTDAKRRVQASGRGQHTAIESE